jgi:hypothetical protein
VTGHARDQISVTGTEQFTNGRIVFVLVNRFQFDASDAPVLTYSLLFLSIASTTAGAILTNTGMSKLMWEVERLYVTMPYRPCDLRDPRDGRIRRRRGTPGGSNRLSVSLRKWRKAAES